MTSIIRAQRCSILSVLLLAATLPACGKGGGSNASSSAALGLSGAGGGNGAALGGSYSFATLAHPSSCMSIHGDELVDETQVEESACSGGAAQVFTIEDMGDGTVNLVHPQSGKCIDVYGAGQIHGTNVDLFTCNGTVAQQFWLETDTSGYVTFQNPNSGKCLDVTGANTADGTKIEIWDCNGGANQKWQPWSGGLSSSSIYSFETVLNGTSCLDVFGGSAVDGTQVEEFGCNGYASQSFTVQPLGSGLVSLENENGKCVDIYGGATADLSKVDVWDCNQGVAQQLVLQVDEDQNVTFVNPHSGKCLDIFGAETADKTVVDLFDCNDGNNQKWRPVQSLGCTLTASVPSIVQGQTVGLTWTAPGATSFVLDLQDPYLTNPTGTSGSASVTPWRAVTTYTATATNATSSTTCSVSVDATAAAPHADVLTVSDNQILDNGLPFTVHGVNLDAFDWPVPVLSSWYVSNAYDHFGVEELEYAKQFGANTINFKVGGDGFDPSNPPLGAGGSIVLTPAQHDTYVSEVVAGIQLARSLGFVVFVTFLGSSAGGQGMPTAQTLSSALAMASDFAYDRGVMFEMFNEPYGTSTCTWSCYIEGGIDQGVTYVGVNAMISQIRALGAENLILVQALVQDFAGYPDTVVDPGNNMAFGVHPYFEFSTIGTTTASWDTAFGNFAQSHPLIATEWNENTGTVGGIADTWCTTQTDVLIPLTLLNYVEEKGLLGVCGWSFDDPATFVTDDEGTPRTMVNASSGTGYYPCDWVGGGVGVWLEQYFMGTLPPGP